MPIPVITVSQMRDWENASWAAGRKEALVIARVGQAVAERVLQMVSSSTTVLVLAGKGHNGDDARKAFHSLKRLKPQADLKLKLCEVKNLARDFDKVCQQLAAQPALIVDGLFGVGLNRPLDKKWCELIARINELQTEVLAIDVPSGLNADTGEPMGAAICASVTLTVGAPKIGLLQPPAWPHVGRLEVASDVGLIQRPVASALNWTLAADFSKFPPKRAAISNKGNFGHVAIIAGSNGYHGAGVLASRGAQRAQPGLVTVYPVGEIYSAVASQLQAVMVHSWKRNVELPGKYSAILAGPGLAAKDLPDAVRKQVKKLWRDAPVAMVADASALDWIREIPSPGTRAIRVITPHPGEAARLLGVKVPEVQADRLKALRKISRQLGDCWVVLKGAQTLIGRAHGEVIVNSSGNPQLAQGGSGDVLAGFLAGLLAQPELQKHPLKTLAYGVWAHGFAADRLSAHQSNWIVEELIERLGDQTAI